MKVVNFLKWFLGVTLVGALMVGAGYAGKDIKVYNPLSKDTIVSGIHLTGKTRDQLLKIAFNPADIKVTVKEKDGETEQFVGGDILSNPVDEEAFKNILKFDAFSLNNSIEPFGFFGAKMQDPSILHFYQTGLENTVAKLPAVTAEEVVSTTDAYGTYNSDTGKFDPVAEKIGTEVDTQLLENKIVENFNNATTGTDQMVDLASERIYKHPKIAMGSPELAQQIETLNKAVGTEITYETDRDTATLTGDTYGSWLRIDSNGQMVLDDAKYKEYMSGVAEDLNLYTSKEEAMKKKIVMTGYLINYDQELAAATEAIRSNQNLDRTFEEFDVTIDDIATAYTAENQPRLDQLKAEYGPEFVYISIDQQFMWYFKDNNLLVATPVTTGTEDAYDTPKGVFNLQYKARNVTLKGRNGDGSKYESFVNYWMPFDGDVGIHDADGWRSEYGGDVFTYSGSHGCVNTPLEKADDIYENISEDCPVIVE